LNYNRPRNFHDCKGLRGAIVNISRVRELRASGGEVVVVLRDGTRLPVSRRRRPMLVAALG